MRKLLPVLLIALALPAAAQPGCGPAHALTGVAKNGRILILDDETVWHLDDDDGQLAREWEIEAPIVICGNQITNREANETVTAVKTDETPDDVENELAAKPAGPGVAEPDAAGGPMAAGQAQADDPAQAGGADAGAPWRLGAPPANAQPQGKPPPP